MHNDPPSPILHKLWHNSFQLGVVEAIVVVVDDDFVDVAAVASDISSVVVAVASDICGVVNSVVCGRIWVVDSVACDVPFVLADAVVFVVVNGCCVVVALTSDVFSVLKIVVVVSTGSPESVIVENKIVVVTGSFVSFAAVV